MSIAEQVTQLKEDFDNVYEAGKKAEWSDFWDAFQVNGNRTNYAYAFHGNSQGIPWFKPKYDIKPITMDNCFYNVNYYGDKTHDLAQMLLDAGVTLDTSNCRSFSNAFAYADITRLPCISVIHAESSGALNNMFNSCTVKKIDKFQTSELTTYTPSTFMQATLLEEITVEGRIAKNYFVIQWSSKLTKGSLLSILNALKDYSKDTSGTNWTVTIGATNKAKLTEDELLIARNKGWTVY